LRRYNNVTVLASFLSAVKGNVTSPVLKSFYQIDATTALVTEEFSANTVRALPLEICDPSTFTSVLKLSVWISSEDYLEKLPAVQVIRCPSVFWIHI
jgi:hypothetical protein